MLSAGDPGQPALVLLHGFMGDAAEWGPVAERLSGRHYCLAPTLPGHDGRPPAAEDFAGLAEALWQRLAPQLPERFALAGYSLGGRLALALAQRCPQRLTGLILEGAHPGLRDAAEREQRRAHDEAWAARLEQEPRAQALAAWYRQPVFASLSEAQRRALVERRAGHDPRHLAALLRAASLAGQPDLRPALAALPAPTAYLAGGDDAKFLALGEALSAEIPGVRLVKIAGVGHNCHAEAPEAIAEAIHTHLDREAARP